MKKKVFLFLPTLSIAIMPSFLISCSKTEDKDIMGKVREYFSKPSTEENIDKYLKRCFKDILEMSYRSIYDPSDLENDEAYKQFIDKSSFSYTFGTFNENDQEYKFLNFIEISCFVNDKETIIGTVTKGAPSDISSYNMSNEAKEEPNQTTKKLFSSVIEKMRVSVSGVKLYYEAKK